MALLSNSSDLLSSKMDPRVADWPLMSWPFTTLVMVLAYLVFVTQGPKVMERYRPWDLRGPIIVYNFLLVILSAFLVYEFMMSSWAVPGFSLVCQPMDYSNDPVSVRLAGACWWFFISKLIEMMDTVFFVLRKKNNQISFLHVYHHSTMPVLWWLGSRFVGGGEAYFSASINSGIHVLMYLYYMLSAMGPAVQPYLWWKKYMTRLQLAQFWLIVCKTCLSIYADCGYPVEYEYFLILYMFSHILLFSNFYYKTYHEKRKLKREAEEEEEPQTPLENNNDPKPDCPTQEELGTSLRERR